MAVLVRLGCDLTLPGYPTIVKGSELQVVEFKKRKINRVQTVVFVVSAGEDYPKMELYPNSAHYFYQPEGEPEIKIIRYTA